MPTHNCPQCGSWIQEGEPCVCTQRSSLSTDERNARVAEKVMGWTHIAVDADGVTRGRAPGADPPKDRVPIPSYTTNLLDAWEIIEKITSWMNTSQHSYHEPVIRKHHNRWECYWKSIADASPPRLYGVADTVTEAICLASLKVVSDVHYGRNVI